MEQKTIHKILTYTAIGGLLWYGVLRGVKGLVVAYKGYSFNSVDLANGVVNMNLNIQISNPLFVGMTLKGIIGDVYAQGHQVGYVNQQFNYYLAGRKTHIIPVRVSINISEVGNAALLNIQSGDIRTLSIAFDGKLLVGNYSIGVPLRFELDYNDLTGVANNG